MSRESEHRRHETDTGLVAEPQLDVRTDVIIPALNEAGSIAGVVRAIPRSLASTVIVVDNGSSDGTAEHARAAGALVVEEGRRGYGAACLAGIRALPEETEIVAFLDGDGSDDPACLALLVEPIAAGRADFVVGSRALGRAEPGALSLQQRAGNAIAAAWLQARFRLPATDLGPFRAIRRRSLDELRMQDRNYGWTVEMQLKAARAGLRYVEVPVPYRRRANGTSKVSGTIRGTLGASLKILGLLAWHDVAGIGRRTP